MRRLFLVIVNLDAYNLNRALHVPYVIRKDEKQLHIGIWHGDAN